MNLFHGKPMQRLSKTSSSAARSWLFIAMYQRRKGRDLFDLYAGLTHGQYDADEIIQCYNRYMAFVVENPPTYKQFVNNMEAKLNDEEFLGDTMGLLRPELSFDPTAAYHIVKETLIDRLQK